MRSTCLLVLALASGSACALGLGQIQVKSRPGQPLLAEIPVITSDASELVELQAGLASPETFTRIGLEPPIGVIADLQFVVANDSAGRPIIRVTSSQPVTQPMLTFLIEVDWGQGRLVREYSAMLATPGSVAGEPVAPVQAPVVDAPGVIERPVVPAATTAAAPQQAAPRPTPPRPIAQSPAAPSSAVEVLRTSPPMEGERVTVRSGDTLSGIASRVAPEGVTAEQAMVGMLRANPEAFTRGDANQLRRGSVLRVPATQELQVVEAREAAAIVRTFGRQWREARTQPKVAGSVTAAKPAGVPASSRQAAVAAAGGRLEIVPPGGGRATRAGQQSGIAAGGEGEMLRQELQQTKETLAARDAEVQELRSRLTELERLQTDQKKLLALQQSQMAAAQQRTGEAVEKAASPPVSPLPWIIGVALVLLGLAVAAWARRRARTPDFRTATAGTPSIAEAFGATPVMPDPKVTPAPVAPAPAAADITPSWQKAAPSRAAAPAAVPEPSAATGWRAPLADEAVGLAPEVDASNAERLELAQACLDLGDTANARRLLDEVASSGDATARGVASRMLRTIE